MSRRRREKITYYYCPKCSKKKLRGRFVDDPTVKGRYGACRQIWECDNDKVLVAGGGIGDCGCVISTPGRDAEIADYVNVLDRMVEAQTPGTQILTWILGNMPGVHKTGLKVLYAGQHIDVVRLRDEDGIMIQAFFRHGTWDKQEEDLGRQLAAACGEYIQFRGTSMRQIFAHSFRYTLFSKDKSQSSWNPPFFKKVSEETPQLLRDVELWAAEFDKEFPTLVEQIKAADEIWDREERSIKDAVHQLSGGLLGVESYDHIKNRAFVRIHNVASKEQILAMAEALKSAGLAPVTAPSDEEDDADDD